MRVTHSLLTSRPSSMRVGDSRWPLRYFFRHCARSCDISFSWMYSQPVHSSMSCIYCLLGLPWCRNPSMIPSRTVSANCPALPRVMWPKYCSFSFATLPINSLSRPNSVNIESFVWCSCHEMLSIFLQHHISKASILFLSNFFKVHASTPYWNTACPHHWLHHFDSCCSFYISVFPDTGQYNSLLSSQCYASFNFFGTISICWLVWSYEMRVQHEKC